MKTLRKMKQRAEAVLMRGYCKAKTSLVKLQSDQDGFGAFEVIVTIVISVLVAIMALALFKTQVTGFISDIGDKFSELING